MSALGDVITRSLQTTGTFCTVVVTGILCANYPEPPRQLLSLRSLQVSRLPPRSGRVVGTMVM